MRDLHDNIGFAYLVEPATLAADNTPAAVDLRGFDAACFAIEVGIGGITFSGTNKIEFVLTHSDDNQSYAPVAQADVLGVTVASGGIVYSLIATHAASTVTKGSYIGGKRYLKLLADFSGTHGTGTPMAAVAVLGNAAQLPVA